MCVRARNSYYTVLANYFKRFVFFVWKNKKTTRLGCGQSLPYDIYYATHVDSFGWLGWAKNGDYAGTSNYSAGVQAIYIKLVPKGESAPDQVGSTSTAYKAAGTLASGTSCGSQSGGSPYYKTCLQWKETTSTTTGRTIQYRCYISVNTGWKTSTTMTTDWGTTCSGITNTSGSAAEKCSSGWLTYGTVSYGSTFSKSCTAGYTGYSSNKYSSTASVSHKVSS